MQEEALVRLHQIYAVLISADSEPAATDAAQPTPPPVH
jgi:hypothetical protein